MAILCLPWQSSEIPLGADVGTRPENDKHVLLPDHLNEPCQVQKQRKVTVSIAKVKDALFRFMQVPRDITEISLDIVHVWFTIGSFYELTRRLCSSRLPCTSLGDRATDPDEPGSSGGIRRKSGTFSRSAQTILVHRLLIRIRFRSLRSIGKE